MHEIATDFESKWNFLNRGSSQDGKLVAIVKPADERSNYFYKGYHSVILLEFVDADLIFTMADVGCIVRISDAGVMEEAAFHTTLKNGAISLSKMYDTVEK
jgi:hypothetical protein